MRQLLKEAHFSKELNFLFLSIFISAISLGINAVSFPTILVQHHISSSHIGIAATFEIAAGIVASLFLSKIVKHLGILKTSLGCCIVYGAFVSLIFFYQNFYLWLIMLTFIGMAWFSFVTIRQAWINTILPSKKRAIGLGIFSVSSSLGLAMGPIIVSILGAGNYLSFIISALFFLLSYRIISTITNKSEIKIESENIKLRQLFMKTPQCFFAKLFLDFQTYFLVIFTVVFGKEIGLSAEKAGLLLSGFLLSGFFDFMIGFLVNKKDPQKLINASFITSLIIFVTIHLYHDNYFILLLLYFIFGICCGIAYIASLSIVNHEYQDQNLVAINSTFQAVGAIGAISSVLIGGYLMTKLGKYGFTLNIIGGCLLYLMINRVYKKRQD